MSNSVEVAANQLIVLGGGVAIEDGQGHMNKYSQERADRTISYYFSERPRFSADSAVIVCSGGYSSVQHQDEVPESYREASLMADYLVQAEVPLNLIEKETESTTTLTNLLNVLDQGYIKQSDITAENPLGVVSHPRHLKRLTYFAAKIGISADVIQKIPTSQQDQVIRELLVSTFYRTLVLRGLSDPEAMRHSEQDYFRRLGLARKVVRKTLNCLPV